MAMDDAQLTLSLQELDVDKVLSGASMTTQQVHVTCPRCTEGFSAPVKMLDTTKLRRRFLAMLRGEHF